MMVHINKNVSKEKWRRLIERTSFISPFQTPEYYKLFNSVKGFSADVFALEEKDEYVALVVVTVQREKGIKGYFSRRGIIYGGLLLKEQVSTLSEWLGQINSYYLRKLIYLEMRNYHDYSLYKPQISGAGWTYVPWLNFQLDCTDNEKVIKGISSGRMRQIKKAIKTGASWKEAGSLEEVKIFYDILKQLYRSKVKKPLMPWAFFRAFYEQGQGKYLLVYFNDKVIGGIMCPVVKNEIIYEFYVCGLDAEYKEYYPSIMATWAAIEYARQNKIRLFDFMGAGKFGEDYGVKDFKARFGGKEVEHGRFEKVLNPMLYFIGKTGITVLQKMSKKH
jgi:serine/alanine adding enzyme